MQMQPTAPASSDDAPPPPLPDAAPPSEEVEMSKEAEPEAEAEVKDVEAKGKDEEDGTERQRRGRGRKRGRRRGTGGGRGGSGTSPSSRAVAMVKRELLVRCMTCPLCDRLLRDATTVSECLHTFCRKCIYKKFNDEEVESCPVCKIDLGCTPVEKLRADHNIQDVRSKIFPLKRKKIKAEEVAAPVSLPSKRKERSISSLVVNTPKVTATGLTGRRTRAVARKSAALRGLGPVIHPVKKENDNGDNHAQNSTSLPGNPGKVPQTRRQASNVEASNHSSNKGTEDDNKELEDKADELWRPLNCLVEAAANRTKLFRSSSQNVVVKKEQLSDSPSSTSAIKTKAREHPQKSKLDDDKKDAPVLKRKIQGTVRRRRELQPPADVKPVVAATQNEKKFSSIWFSLVASFEQKGDPPLPQIPSPYLRIKDGNVPASSIQNYLMQKLSLPSDAEVEINCCGQPVSPTQPLCNLVELWLKGQSSQTAQTMIGSSAKEFVMVLTYGRSKTVAP